MVGADARARSTATRRALPSPTRSFPRSGTPNRARCPNTRHAVPHFCLLLGGTYEEYAHGERIVFAPQTIVYRPAHASHWDIVGGERGVLLHRRARRGSGKPRSAPRRAGDPHLRHLRRRDGVARDAASRPLPRTRPGVGARGGIAAIRTVRTRRHDAARCLRGAGVVQRGRGAHRRGVRRRLDLRELARAPSVHPAHFTRVFRRFHGRSIGEEVAALRVQLACRLLAGGDAPLTDVAAACGFADQSHLTRVFHAHTGATPARYRKRLRPCDRGRSRPARRRLRCWRACTQVTSTSPSAQRVAPAARHPWTHPACSG